MGYFLACSEHNINTLLLGGGEEEGGGKDGSPKETESTTERKKGYSIHICKHIHLHTDKTRGSRNCADTQVGIYARVAHIICKHNQTRMTHT